MKKTIQMYYNLIQFLYWICIGLTFSYASVYLQSRGSDNSQIGLVLGAAYVLAALLQPIIAATIDRCQLPMAKGVVIIYGLAAALAFLLYMGSLSIGGMLVIMTLDFALFYALQPCVNFLAMVLEKVGYPVDYGAVRGVCSLEYAVVMALVGLLLRRISPLFLPLTYAVLAVVSIVLLISFRPLLQGKLQVRVESTSGFPTFREFPMFWIFLCGVVCLATGHCFHLSFLLQIMQNVGGDSGSVGLATGIQAAAEFLPMLFYTRLSKRFGVNRLMILAGWAWIVKALLMFLAPSQMGVYIAHLAQCVTYALYIPGSIELVSRMLPEKYSLKGQSLTVSAFTVGAAIASLFGGVLLDTIGVTGSLGIQVLVMAMGAVLMTVSNLKKKGSLMVIITRNSHIRLEETIDYAKKDDY